jgi:hypothetical protein
MRFIYKYLILCCIVLIGKVVYGQTNGLYSSVLNQSSNSLYGKITGEIYYFPPGGNSNHFLHNEWAPGKVTFRSGEIFDNVKLRYNAFEDELIAYNGNVKVLIKIDKEKIKEFTLNLSQTDLKIPDMTFVNIDSVSAFVNTNYFECLYHGNVMLLVSHRISELKVSPYNDSSGKLRDTEFVLRKANFIYSPLRGLTKIQLSNHAVAKAYPEKKHEILKFMRSKKIKISETGSAIHAFQELDEAGLIK